MYFFLVLFIILFLTTISTIYEKDINFSRIITCIICYAIGIFYIVASDAQKTFTLNIRKGLISNGLFKNTRNPNYLGEIMIYLSFGIVSENFRVYLLLLFFWIFIFGVRFAIKDFSLKKKKGAIEYFKKSYLLFPKIFENHLKNYALYFFIFMIFILFVK